LTGQEVLDLYKTVLTHYTRKAKASAFVEGEPLTGKDFFDADNNIIEQEAGTTLTELAGTHDSREFSEVLRQHRKLLHDAFTVYIADLRQAKSAFEKKLGASPQLKNVNSQLELAEKYSGMTDRIP
jgi:hypothetical protein